MLKSTTFGLIPFFLIFLVSNLSAQRDSTNYYTSDEILSKALSNYFNEEYEVAYRTYNTVNYNDTAFYDAKMDAISALVKQNKYDTVINLCQDVLSRDKFNPDRWQFINSLGHALIQKKRYEEALVEIDKGLEEFPRTYLLWFNRSTACYELKRYDEAVEALQMCIRYNPAYLYGHVRLGYICAEAGELTKAALCMNMAIYTDPSNPETLSYIQLLETIYEGGVEKKIDKLNFRETENFEDIDLLIRNKVAENKSYKTGSKLTYGYVKTNHLVFDAIEYDPNSKGFWSQTYIRFYKEILKRNYYPQFSYYQSLSVSNPTTQKIISKNKSKIIVFRDWSFGYFSEVMNERKVWNGKEYVDNKLRCCGDFGFTEEAVMKNDILQGAYIGYHPNGNVSIRGELSSDGNKEGVWRYFDNDGSITTEEENVNGQLEGTYTTFYRNGSKKFQLEIQNNSALAERLRYYNFDQVYSKEHYNSDGVQDGLSVYYHPNGQISTKVMYKNGKRHGEYISYYSNGQIYEKLNFENDKRNGEYVSYFRNGKEGSKGKFIDDNASGHWTYLYKNGQLKEEGEMKDGYRIGVWKTLREDGKMLEESDYGTTGKKTGIHKEYNREGVLVMELQYKGEDIEKFKVFDSKGDLIKEGLMKKGILEFENYYDNGKLRTKGNFVKGNRNGEWKFYDVNGNIESLEVYNEKGELHGECIEYFANGKVNSSTYYKNGQMDGYFVEYLKNGNTVREGWYREGAPVGEWKFYYTDGTISGDRFFINGELHGEYRSYDEKGILEETRHYYFGSIYKIDLFDTNGVKISENILKDGAGDFKIPNSLGDISEEVSYKGAELDGDIKFYHLNGKVKSQGKFDSDERVGEWKYFHRNGQISSEGIYDNGDRVGVWKWYFENGKLSREQEYQHDELHGKSTYYHENGNISMIRYYYKGRRDGEQTCYDPNGSLQYIRYYRDGELLGYSYNGSDGKPVPMITCNVVDGSITGKFENGKTSYKCSYKNGFNEGEIALYYENGNIQEIGSYKEDELNGIYREYYANGQLMAEYYYKDGNYNGIYKTWYQNGKLKSVENYIDDDLYGWAEYYDANGKMTEKVLFYNDYEVK